jgi:hypothetical protein
MNKHRLIAAVLLIASLISVAGCSPAMQVDRDTIYQTSTIGALMKDK